MNETPRIYLALGDSMSIDTYTGVRGGGAVAQFYRTLAGPWRLDDRTTDGCRMPHVPTDGRGDLVTLTIGGNDLLSNRETYLTRGLDSFGEEHLGLLEAIRRANPQAIFIVGNVYAPQEPLTIVEQNALAEANAMIAENCRHTDAELADIHAAFLGHEADFLCLSIEPTLRGAERIAQVFQAACQRRC
jgi:lysophospholipase L1-like esterase